MLDWSDYEEEQQPQRKTVSPYWALALAVLLPLAIVAALWSGKVYGDEFRSKDVALVRHQTQCDDADILAEITKIGVGHLIEKFKKATLTYGGRDWRSCWIELNGFVYSIDEEGSPLERIPATMFKDAGGA